MAGGSISAFSNSTRSGQKCPLSPTIANVNSCSGFVVAAGSRLSSSPKIPVRCSACSKSAGSKARHRDPRPINKPDPQLHPVKSNSWPNPRDGFRPSLIWLKKQFPARGNCWPVGARSVTERHVGCFRWNRGLVCPLSVDHGMAGPPRCSESARRDAITFQAKTSMGCVAWAMDGIDRRVVEIGLKATSPTSFAVLM